MPGNNRLVPWLFFLSGIWMLWAFGYHTVFNRLSLELEGVVVESRDVPPTKGPRYATEYRLRQADGQERTYWAGATDASLPRSMPLGTQIKKPKWSLSYERNGKLVQDFSLFFYGVVLGIAVALLAGSFFLWRPGRRVPPPA